MFYLTSFYWTPDSLTVIAIYLYIVRWQGGSHVRTQVIKASTLLTMWSSFSQKPFLIATNDSWVIRENKTRFPLPELTARVDG